MNSKLSKAIFFMGIVLLTVSGFAQAKYTISLANPTSTSTTLEVDVLLTVNIAPGERIYIVNAGINYSNSILNGGAPCTTNGCGSWSYIGGRSSQLSGLAFSTVGQNVFLNHPVAALSANWGHLRIVGTNTGAVAADVPNGTYTVGRYRFTNTNSWKASSNAQLWLNPNNTTGSTNSGVTSYPYGASTPQASYSSTTSPYYVTLSQTQASPLTVMLNAQVCATAASQTASSAVHVLEGIMEHQQSRCHQLLQYLL